MIKMRTNFIGDYLRLSQVLTNLLTNALKFYTTLAEEGSADAQTSLGFMY